MHKAKSALSFGVSHWAQNYNQVVSVYVHIYLFSSFIAFYTRAYYIQRLTHLFSRAHFEFVE